MTAIKDDNLAGQVPEYNGVQFGGADSDYSMTPPQYDLSVEAIYDDANREVVAHRCILSVNCWVYNGTEAALSLEQDNIRRLLLEPGRPLGIGNLGMGFVGAEPDIIWGPKPISLRLNAVGKIAVEINWSCEFHSAPCESDSHAGFDPFLKAFNYSTSWSIDPDGNTTRTISGYVEMCQTRSLANPRQVGKVIDAFRDAIDVKVPPCFQRANRNFVESADKTRLDFSVTDVEVINDVLPQGILAKGFGDYGFSTGEMEGGIVTQILPALNVTLYTADGVPYEHGLRKCLEIAKSKQDAMTRNAGKAAIFVTSISIVRGMFSEANRTTLSVTWLVSGLLEDHLKASGIFEPMPDSNYNAWKASIKHTWGNRGNRKLVSNGSDDMIISVCDQVGGVTIGNGGQGCDDGNDSLEYGVECPPVDRKYSYIKYDVKLRYLRQDDQQAYKPATLYSPGEESSVPPISQTGLTHPGFYSTGESTEEVTEHYGYPQQVVRLSFVLARLHFKPEAPRLRSINGKSVESELINEWTESKTVADYGCPIHTLIGYFDYRIKDHVERQLKNYGSPLIPNGDPHGGDL